MFWRSVVVKLWFTILLFFTFVLLTLTILLLQFFENFHEQEAEADLMQTASKVKYLVEEYEERHLLTHTIEQVMDPSSRVVIVFDEEDYWISKSEDTELAKIELEWFYSDVDLSGVLKHEGTIKKKTELPNTNNDILIVGQPLADQLGAVFVYQSLDIVKETTSETTKLIILAAGIAIVLTTFFAFFLSTRITSPLIKMRKAALELAKGEFHTKVPILTHDEIGELAIAFNRMGRQLKFHIHALNQEKEQLTSILLSMADGVITLNRNGEILVTNPPAERFLQFLHFEVTDEKLVLPEELKETLKQAITEEQEVMKELSHQGRNYVVIMSPLYDQSYVRGAVAVIRDMTEERQMDKLRKDFIANVSHELRTPISMLQGYSEAIVDDIAETKEEKNELASIIYDESLRMGRLVNELLDLARMEAGHIQLHVMDVELEPYLKKIVKKFYGVANERGITLKYDFHFEEDIASFDPDRIEQVLTNLIDNAIRHTSEGGTVTLLVEETNDMINFHVKDSGSGIEEDDLPFVFERFYKADKSRAKRTGGSGTGLGLAIAKNIVHAHKGTIEVHSKKNEGTTFVFHLPKSIKI
ncbi:two-component system sensor histidine kinase ResE [Salirhabdus euzebyi]|uniref:histidine kinase n=1 Tax=Salirhabdus euzebyi TaxID=394506 RepID=A0A841Q9C3_9BACI|nr:ATP-binding protein [Salirhabdus euzebyi]MBB6455279.1 two-component system sensor histidine kinase ResE [Salirhabdus euzebyi]